MNKNKHRTMIISSEEMSTNSYNTSEEEEEISKQDFKNSIRIKKERMNKFFLENPNLLNYFDFKEDYDKENQHYQEDFRISKNKKAFQARFRQTSWQATPPRTGNPFTEKLFLEDMKRKKENKKLSEIEVSKKKMVRILNEDVSEQMNLKNKGNTKALEQLFKKINVFKSRVLESDKSPFIDTILEEEVDYQSDNDSEDSNQYKKLVKKKGDG